LKVRPRLRHGEYLPHPGIEERRTAAMRIELERPRPVYLDGKRVGDARVLSLRVEPDALTVVV
jgi:diacylglycerol kinase family enzyme